MLYYGTVEVKFIFEVKMKKVSYLEWMTFDEVVYKTGISRRTIYRMIEKKTFPKPVKYLNKFRWNPEEVQAAIDKIAASR